MIRPALILTIFTLLLSACLVEPVKHSTAPYGFKPIKAEFNIEGNPKIVSITGDGQSRLLVIYEKGSDKFFRISTDAGASFGQERNGASYPRFVAGGLAGIYTAASPAGSMNIFYVRSYNDGETWTEPVQINDEEGSVQWGYGGGMSFVQTSQDDIYCIWTDRRRGFSLLFFSASHDGGRTWSPNQVIEYDFREGDQSGPRLQAGADGRLMAFWIDWRDRQTLADIRCSYSDDKGQHWSSSQKINDDREHVWQVDISTVAAGNQIYVAFTDFREPGEEGDNDWNVYFARSEDNGKTWTKNIRLNDIKVGRDGLPHLEIDERGTLYCAWVTGRESIFGQIAFSYSIDKGRSWSPSIRVDEGKELRERLQCSFFTVAGGRLLCHWVETGYGTRDYRLAWLEPLSQPETTKPQPPKSAIKELEEPIFGTGKVLFADNFLNENHDLWQNMAGTWMVVDGAYMGVEPSLNTTFSSFARFEEPDSYILRGRFKLDPVHHHMAYLFFRADPERDSYYTIVHRFRYGAWLSLRENGLTAPNHIFIARPLVERRFPFQNNRWYNFTLVVTPERIDYFINHRLMLSYSGPLDLQPGRFGIGGSGKAPTYFDDITVSDFNDSTEAARIQNFKLKDR
jgi:hypothetical protein